MFNGYRIFARDDKNVLGIESGDGYTALSVFLVPLNCVPIDG